MGREGRDRQTAPAAKGRHGPDEPALASDSIPVPIAIAAPRGLFRELLSGLLGGDPQFRVVGEAESEQEIEEVLRRRRPRVLVLDEEALGKAGEKAIARLRRATPTRILVLATRPADVTVRGVLRSGAAGLVGKELGSRTLIRAIRAVAAGEVWADRLVTARTLEDLAGDRVQAPAAQNPLTRREREIAEGVAGGLRNKEIARRLRITEKTVKSHLHHIFRKLQVDNRFAVGLYTLERGLEDDARERESP
jgi:DNA-binding NarL/FixJ family response regulator